MPLTPEDIRIKAFTTVRLREGYDANEVDDFLDRVKAELTRLLRKNQSLRTRLATTSPGPHDHASTAPAGTAAPGPQHPDTASATRLLELAQKVADEASTTARRDADTIIRQAHNRAQALEDAARTLADGRRREAETAHQTAIGALEGRQAALEALIDDLFTRERQHHAHLKSHLELQLSQLQEPPATVSPAEARTSTAPPLSCPDLPPVKIPRPLPVLLHRFRLRDEAC